MSGVCMLLPSCWTGNMRSGLLRRTCQYRHLKKHRMPPQETVGHRVKRAKNFLRPTWMGYHCSCITTGATIIRRSKGMSKTSPFRACCIATSNPSASRRQSNTQTLRSCGQALKPKWLSLLQRMTNFQKCSSIRRICVNVSKNASSGSRRRMTR